MKLLRINTWKVDLLFLIGVVSFFFSCVMTSFYEARTLDKGQGSISGTYMRVHNAEDLSDDPINLVGLGLRVGAGDNFDIGLNHTLDVTKNNDNAFNAFWVDCKLQLSNRENKYNRLTFSPGLMKGYIYDSDVDLSVTSIPFYFSLPVSERFSPTFIYRHDFISNKVLPEGEEWTNPRHHFMLGGQYTLFAPKEDKWIKKLSFSIGLGNALDGSPDGNDFLSFGLGIQLFSPGY
ncbi:hypothetical protein [Marinoscillum sp. MHG1-6]|uniref:hypothetical protein n=1 Tax=Marinoscillum sp. MHG1-6 TaxID=2959627 RepID=UPI0021589C15|nr:hypothetical protein [Marinoscillum sp. MHG1-6]